MNGRRILVTGAGHRVGRAVAERLGAIGARVIVHYHRSDREAEETVRLIRAKGSDAALVQGDLTNRNGIVEVARDARAAFGGVDALVTSAANFEHVPFDALSESAWDNAMRLNLESTVWLTHALRDELRRNRGSVVAITDAGALRPHPGWLPYLVSKGALAYAVRALAVELAPDVRVNAVAPGAVLLPEDMSPERRAIAIESIPLAREGGVDVVSDAVLFLLDAEHVTGSELVVDGGQSIAP